MSDQPKRRGRPPKTEWVEPAEFQVGEYTVKRSEDKYLIFIRGSIRAIRHSEQDARAYIKMVS